MNGTPTNTARTELHSVITFHHANTLKSCKAQDCTSVCHQNNCRPRVMSHSLPHLTLTTSTSSLSPISSTSHICPTVSPSHTSPMILNPYILCDVPRQSARSTQIPKRSSLNTSSLEELSLQGILGHIRIKYRIDL